MGTLAQSDVCSLTPIVITVAIVITYSLVMLPIGVSVLIDVAPPR